MGQDPRGVDHHLSCLGFGEASVAVLVEQLERGQLEIGGGSTATDDCQSDEWQECLHFLNESAVDFLTNN